MIPIINFRFEGEILRFGRLHVRNVGIDMATDPLFTITHLELWVEEEEDEKDMNAAGEDFQKKIYLYKQILPDLHLVLQMHQQPKRWIISDCNTGNGIGAATPTSTGPFASFYGF